MSSETIVTVVIERPDGSTDRVDIDSFYCNLGGGSNNGGKVIEVIMHPSENIHEATPPIGELNDR